MGGSASGAFVYVIKFTVQGVPVSKQSFRVANGHGYRDPRVSAWQERVGWAAREAMQGRAPLTGEVIVWLYFRLPTRRRVDGDNLSKGCLDAMNGIVWRDDRQAMELHVYKYDGSNDPGVTVVVAART